MVAHGRLQEHRNSARSRRTLACPKPRALKLPNFNEPTFSIYLTSKNDSPETLQRPI